MKELFRPGDEKVHRKVIERSDTASFQGTQVHPVVSTFALAREIEWSTRLFVLEMKDEDEEGIGTMLSIHHTAPAFPGEELEIRAKVKSIHKNELICSYRVCVGERLVAYGETGQKIYSRELIRIKFTPDDKG